MATTEGAALARDLRAVLDAGPARDRGDAELLDQFSAGPGDAAQAAFAALVERHGPMVLRATEGILGRRHDAEDAFQATFLVLARQAPYLRGRATVGPWLFGVARRTALAARRLRARRAEVERSKPPGQPRDDPDAEAARVVHEEVARLADRDRAVVVLCDLEGESLDHAAQALGCPVGTVKSRLARARGRLRLRLERRGLGAPSALAALGANALAPLDPALSGPVLAAASRFAAAPDLATSVAAHLARGVIRIMTRNRWLASAATTLGATLAVTAGSTWIQAAPPGQDPPPRPPAGAPANPGPAIETAVAQPVFNTKIVTEQATILPPVGVSIGVDLPAGTTIRSKAKPRQPVKVGDVIVELDPAPLQFHQKQYLEQIEATNKNIVTIEAELARLTEAEKNLPPRPASSPQPTKPDAASESIRVQVGRAQARVNRYRAASNQAERVAINTNDPAMLPAVVARLELRDRLEQAEADLVQLRAKLSQEPDSEVLAEKIQQQKAEASRRLSEATAHLNDQKQMAQMYTDGIARCTVRATVDGLFDACYTRAGGFPATVGDDESRSSTFQVRIATLEDPDRELVVIPSTGLNNGPIFSLTPGASVLIRIPHELSVRQSLPRTIPATLVRFIQVDTSANIKSDKRRNMMGLQVVSSPLNSTPLLRLATPIRASNLSVGLEYTASLPTNDVKVPTRAVTRDQRVAVRQPDGTFQWRTVQSKDKIGDPNESRQYVLVNKLLGEGEVVALDPYAAMGETPPPQREPTPFDPVEPAKP